jgi:hypothetical protein
VRRDSAEFNDALELCEEYTASGKRESRVSGVSATSILCQEVETFTESELNGTAKEREKVSFLSLLPTELEISLIDSLTPPVPISFPGPPQGD